METIDLRDGSYETFVSFLFDHPVVQVPIDHSAKPDPWYWSVEAMFYPMPIAAFYMRLFTDPCPLLNQFTDEQLEQGFWAIQSNILNCAVSELIWEQELPFEVRESVVRSMFHLFEKLFLVKPLDTSAHMWWDSLAYDWHCNRRARTNGGEDLRMQDVMFETLQKIARLPSEEVQGAALHGLGHLHHPDTQKFIDDWLVEQDIVNPGLTEYALAAAKFEVM